MVTRRVFAAGLSVGLVGTGVFAVFGTGSGGAGSSMSTDGDGGGCQSTVLERPQEGTFEFVTVVRFEKVTVQLSVNEERIDEIRISAGGAVRHTKRIVATGSTELAFDPGSSTTFTVEAIEDGTVVDSGRFESVCSSESDGGAN
jgi:hypothetical protein